MEYPVNGKVKTVAGRIFDCLISRVKISLFANNFRAEWASPRVQYSASKAINIHRKIHIISTTTEGGIIANSFYKL